MGSKVHWVRRFLKTCSLAYKLSSGNKKDDLSPEVTSDLTKNYLEKIIFTMDRLAVGYDRLMNIDETAPPAASRLAGLVATRRKMQARWQ